MVKFVNWIHLDQDMDYGKHGNKSPGSIAVRVFLYYLRILLASQEGLFSKKFLINLLAMS